MLHVGFAYKVCSDLVFTMRKQRLKEQGGLVSSGPDTLESLW